MNPSDANLKLAAALSHPTRVRILMSMNAPVRCLSPKEFSNTTTTISLSDASHHFSKLHDWGFIELVKEEPRRGAVEHFYRPIKKALAWSKESADLPSTINDRFAATALRGLVEEIGGAIDAGHFSERTDRILAYDKMWLDEAGWTDLVAVYAETFKRSLEIEAECLERQKANGDGSGFYASYGLALFESFPPPRSASRH